MMFRTMVVAAFFALAATPAISNPCGMKEQGRVVVAGYGVGKTAIPEDQKEKLVKFAEAAKHRFGICIFAQVDKQGSAEANARVAESRAQNVRKFLVSSGVDAKYIQIAKQEKGFTLFGLLPKDQGDDRRVVITHD